MGTRTDAKSRTNAASARTSHSSKLYGRIEWLDEQGQTLQSWLLGSQSCIVGSDSAAAVRLESLLPKQLTIVFGRRNTLIKSHSGSFRVGARSVREWLIDEPSTIEVGDRHIRVVPSGFIKEEAESNRLPEVDPAPSSVTAATPEEVHDVAPNLSIPIQNSGEDLKAIIVESTVQAVSKSLEPIHNALQALTARWESAAAQNEPTQSSDIEQRFEQIERQIPLLASEVGELNEKFSSAIEKTDSSMHSMAEDIRSQFEGIAHRFDQATANRESAIENSLAALTEQLSLLQSRISSVSAVEQSQVRDDEEIPSYQDPAQDYYESYDDSGTAYEQSSVQPAREVENKSYADESVTEGYLNDEVEATPNANQAEPEESSWAAASEESNYTAPDSYYAADQDESEIHDGQSEYWDPQAAVRYDSDEAPYSENSFVETGVEERYEEPVSEDTSEHGQPYSHYDQSQSYVDEQSDVSSNYDSYASQWRSDSHSYADASSYEDVSSSQSETDDDDLQDGSQPLTASYTPIARESEVEESDELKSDELPEWFKNLRKKPKTEPVSETRQQQDSPVSSAQDRTALPSWFADPEASHEDTKSAEVMGRDDFSEHDVPSYYRNTQSSREDSEELAVESSPLARELERDRTDFDSRSNTPSYFVADELEAVAEEEGQAAVEEYSSTSASTDSRQSNLSSQETIEEESHEEEESVEAYMQRLLARVKGEGDASFSPPPIVKAPTPTKTSPAQATTPPVQTPRVTPRDPDDETALTSEDYVPRSAAPEHSIDLEAMRKLANETARTAIAKSASKAPAARIIPVKNLVIAAVGFFTGTGILLINGLTLNVFFLGMVCGYLIFLIWGYEATQSGTLPTKRS